MREIKFRGKRKDNGKWVYGFVRPVWTPVDEEYERLAIYDEDNLVYGSDGWVVVEGLCEIIPETVGQYTGLKDKNGKEIYEGDIIECSDFDGTHYSVLYENGAFGYITQPHNSFAFLWFDRWTEASDLDVIGNIHDNPELLEASNESRK